MSSSGHLAILPKSGRIATGWPPDDSARVPVLELRRGKLTRLSLETLIRYLERLHHRVDISVTHVRPYRRQLNK